ncbi:unnamed protein product [Schistocephalus solidus]|uniref:C2H2-type domain-containing protein n=1 Tax=Schistocephalus solidus TaxID=70667 RepID=A0A183TDN3_SCHSO|nr:unnamed protein product [Schistocephalus solidus]
MRPHIHLTHLTGEPVPGAPTHNRDRRLRCPHCPRAFTHRVGLFGHMRICDSGIHRNADNNDTSCTPSIPSIHTATATPTTMNDIPPAFTDFSCPKCARIFNSAPAWSVTGESITRKLVNQCQGFRHTAAIHRTEAGEPGPGAPTYSRRARLTDLLAPAHLHTAWAS